MAQSLLFLGALTGVVLILAACGPGKEEQSAGTSPPTAEQTVMEAPPKTESLVQLKIEKSFEIDPSKIVGSTTEERTRSLVSLFNVKTSGFAKLFGNSEKVTGATPEESGTIYRYGLMVYGDEPKDKKASEEYLNKILVVVKQVVVYSAKFVADAQEQSVVRVQVSYPTGEQEAHVVSVDGVKMLRTSPSESGLQFVQPVSLIVVPYDDWQEAQQIIVAFRVARDEGYISEEELSKAVEKMNEMLKQQSEQPAQSPR
jgi:hypothetical protein